MNNQNENGMSEIVKMVCRIIEGFIFLFGMYIVLFGHLTPGGGFAGGVILASAFVLILLAFGKERLNDVISEKTGLFLESFGALVFILGAAMGMLIMNSFFANYVNRLFGSMDFRFLSSGNILIYNIAIGVKVMAELFTVIYFLSVTHIFLKKRKKK